MTEPESKVQEFLRKHAPNGGALTLKQQEELGRLILEEGKITGLDNMPDPNDLDPRLMPPQIPGKHEP